MTVSVAERRRDQIALAIFGVGAFLYIYAFVGMRALTTQHLVTVFPHQQERRFTLLWLVSRVGLGVGVIGGLTMVWSYLRYRQRPAEPQ